MHKVLEPPVAAGVSDQPPSLSVIGILARRVPYRRFGAADSRVDRTGIRVHTIQFWLRSRVSSSGLTRSGRPVRRSRVTSGHGRGWVRLEDVKAQCEGGWGE
jgi:hypothetical protein